MREVRTRLNTTSRRPTVATTSPSQRGPPVRLVVDQSTAGRSNIRLANTVPATAPTTWAMIMDGTSRPARCPSAQAARVTAGLKSAEMVPKTAMTATRTQAVATAFWNSWRPWSVGLSRAAMIPDPTTPTSRKRVPVPSASRRRVLTCSGRSVKDAVDQRVDQGLPGGLDDVLRHPDGGPGPLTVGGVDEHPGHSGRALAGF